MQGILMASMCYGPYSQSHAKPLQGVGQKIGRDVEFGNAQQMSRQVIANKWRRCVAQVSAAMVSSMLRAIRLASFAFSASTSRLMLFMPLTCLLAKNRHMTPKSSVS